MVGVVRDSALIGEVKFYFIWTVTRLTRSWLSFGQIFVENPVTTCRELSCTIAASTLMGRLTEKLILLAQIVLVGVGILSLVFGVFALIGTWLSHGS